MKFFFNLIKRITKDLFLPQGDAGGALIYAVILSAVVGGALTMINSLADQSIKQVGHTQDLMDFDSLAKIIREGTDCMRTLSPVGGNRSSCPAGPIDLLSDDGSVFISKSGTKVNTWTVRGRCEGGLIKVEASAPLPGKNMDDTNPASFKKDMLTNKPLMGDHGTLGYSDKNIFELPESPLCVSSGEVETISTGSFIIGVSPDALGAFYSPAIPAGMIPKSAFCAIAIHYADNFNVNECNCGAPIISGKVVRFPLSRTNPAMANCRYHYVVFGERML